MQLRESLVLEFWDRSKEINIKNKPYSDFVLKLQTILLKTDLGKADLTTNSLIKKNQDISALIIAKENGVLAGLDEFRLLNKDLRINSLKNDGDKIKKNDILIEMNGNAGKILERERINLNLLQRMSGIATKTNFLVNKLENRIRIAATRKTLWGRIDKKAVSLGGGLTHRLGLSDGIIIKDNHLKILDYNIEEILRRINNRSKYVEIEVENENQAMTAAKCIQKLKKNFNKRRSLFAIMLDKINAQVVKSIVKELKGQNLYEQVLLEASGNIAPGNIGDYKECGADIISLGCLTNSAKILNMSLEIE